MEKICNKKLHFDIEYKFNNKKRNLCNIMREHLLIYIKEMKEDILKDITL